MTDQTPPPIPEVMRCPGCGRVLSLRATFCADCGWRALSEEDRNQRLRLRDRRQAFFCLGGGSILFALGFASGDTMFIGAFRYVLGPASYLMMIFGFAKLLGVLFVRK